MSALSIFLSHASEDSAPTRKLHFTLKSAGFAPWLDEEELLPGQDWELEIKRALRRSDFCIILLSKLSVVKQGFLQREIKRAYEKFEEFPDGSIYLIPARLDDCEIPERLSRQQRVDLFHPNGVPKLLKALEYEAERRRTRIPPASTPSPIAELSVVVTSTLAQRVMKLQTAANRLRPNLEGIKHEKHTLASVIGRWQELIPRWTGKIPPKEHLRRLELMQSMIDQILEVLNQIPYGFIGYADVRIGIGPGNLEQAVAAYRQMKAQIPELIRRTMMARQTVQKQTWLADFFQATMNPLDQIRTRAASVESDIRQFGEI
jgi:hypothetical protein